MKPKNTIGLWFETYAENAARWYAATLPNSAVTKRAFEAIEPARRG